MAERKNTSLVIFTTTTIALGLLVAFFTVQFSKRKLNKSALGEAVIVAKSINPKRLVSLTGTEADLNSPDYLRLKEQLLQIRVNHQSCRFLYLMGRKKDGTVFFFLDSQTSDSKDYAPPGLIYTEVPDEYLRVFDSGEQRTVGPITDRWGTLVTSLVPIYHPETKKIIAMLGMDVEANDWNNKIIMQSMLPVGLTLLVTLLIIFLVLLNRSKQNIRGQYEKINSLVTELKEALQQVKTLQGILPICSGCKKIRDDEGSWTQLESYIRDHSEAEFSHGLCPGCAKDLYPQVDFQKDKEKP